MSIKKVSEIILNKKFMLYFFSLLLGAIIWIVIAFVSGNFEAWDSKYYFVYGLPIMMATSGIFGFIDRFKPWRWGLTIVLPQAFILLLLKPTANLLPIGLAVFGLVSALCVSTAYAGAIIRSKFRN